MRKATKNDIPTLIEIFKESFKRNRSTTYVLKDRSTLPKLFKYSIAKGFLFGDVWINEDQSACAILIDPKKKKFSFKSLWLDIKLIFQVVGLTRVKKVLHKENVTEATLPKELDFIHLWFLAVSPKAQGKGKGTALLKEIIAHYRPAKQAICLETSTLQNLPFYEKEGFEVYSKKDFGFTLYFYRMMLKD